MGLRGSIGLLAVLAVAASAPAFARNGQGSSPWAAPCAGQAVSAPFSRWQDSQPYTLVPGGTFEVPGSWALENGAAIVGGNEPFFVHAGGDSTSLLLVPGASATTKPMCVTLKHPAIRMFVRNLGTRFSFFRICATFMTASGTLRTVEVAKLAATSRWAPSPSIPYLVNMDVPLGDQGTTAVAFRFTGLAGVTMIDDVFVDPRVGR